MSRNPVGRLHAVLSAFPQTTTTIGQWLASYFEVEDSTPAVQMELYADLAHLVVASLKTVDEIPGFEDDDRQEFREHINVVANAIAQFNPQRLSYEFKAQIPDSTMTGLRMYSRFLTNSMPENIMESNAIDDLLLQTQEIFDSLLGADLNPELKAILLEHLSSIERALRLYSLSGSVGLRRAADGLAGGVLFGYVEHSDDNSRKWLKRCGTLAGTIASLIGLVANARTALPEFFEHLLKLPIGQ